MTTTGKLDYRLKDVYCFVGVFPCDRLPKIRAFPASLIINNKPASDPGEHWVAIHIDENRHGQYFDPYGFDPLEKEIVDFLGYYCTGGWLSFPYRLQGGLSIKCGEFCSTYVYLKSIGANDCEIVKYFTNDFATNDEITAEYFKKL